MSRRRVRSRVLATFALIAAPSLTLAPMAAATTKSFRQATAKDFEEGEATGTTILPAGEVIPGLIVARAPVAAAFVWSATLARDGATAYFGTGDEGAIFAVPTRGGGAPTARRLGVLDAPWVTALATRADGTLLAGTTPGGRVFTVDPKSGASKAFATIDAGHVWALARDDKAGLTYVASGAPGKVFSVDDKGKAREVWNARDKHVVALVRDNDGTLLAGTSEEAILYRVHPDGHAEALQDFDAEEVRAIVRAPSGLFVAVNDFEKATGGGTPAPGPVAAKGTRIVLSTGGPPASAGGLPRPGARKAKSAVYRIDNDGRIEQVFALADGYLTALAVVEDGSVLAASGTQGHVYRVTTDGAASLVIDAPERQVLALVRAGGETLLGTGDVGGIYRAATPGAGGARYLSKVLDAEHPARWGALRWQGTGVGFETRSGNTAKPDPSWNAWIALQKPEADAAGGSGHVASPGARYVQYRATVAAPRGRLRGVTTYFLPQNQRPRVTEVTLADAAMPAGMTLGAAPTPGAHPPHSATLKLRWKVDNTDGNDLVYRLWMREQTETTWRPLAGVVGDPLVKAEYDWNTDGIPDGLYIVHVTASDERSEPRERALSSSYDSAPLLVDNGRPQILDLAARLPVVSGRARDAASPLGQLEYAIDGGDWQLVAPSDGIADELVEPFSFRLPALARGPHTVVVRAIDGADNIGASDLQVKIP